MTAPELAELILNWPSHNEEIMLPQIQAFCKAVASGHEDDALEYREVCDKYARQAYSAEVMAAISSFEEVWGR